MNLFTFKNKNDDIAIRFRMPGLRIKVNRPIFANFHPKIGYHGNVSWDIGKLGPNGQSTIKYLPYV